jgi:L-lactate dehydrogenase complex protein LldE
MNAVASAARFRCSRSRFRPKWGYDKVEDHHRAGAEYIVSADMSCLMHQKGCAERLGLDIGFIHIAQVLNGGRG